MYMLIAIALCSTARSVSICTPDNRTQQAVIVDSFDIDLVWAGHPVAFFLLTHSPYQYLAFYDSTRQLTVGQRNLSERVWTLNKLSDVTGWDSHDYLVMAIDDDGYIHLSGDEHVVPLKYFRTITPLNASTFSTIGQNDWYPRKSHYLSAIFTRSR